ncbi:hypothetical protein ACHAWT_003899, partial [Skeletonema menzelii]
SIIILHKGIDLIVSTFRQNVIILQHPTNALYKSKCEVRALAFNNDIDSDKLPTRFVPLSLLLLTQHALVRDNDQSLCCL